MPACTNPIPAVPLEGRSHKQRQKGYPAAIVRKLAKVSVRSKTCRRNVEAAKERGLPVKASHRRELVEK